MLSDMRLKRRQIMYVSNQRAVLTSFRVEDAPREGTELVGRSLCERNATDSRNFGILSHGLGDEGTQLPLFSWERGRRQGYLKLQPRTQDRRDDSRCRITDVAAEEPAFVRDRYVIVLRVHRSSARIVSITAVR